MPVRRMTDQEAELIFGSGLVIVGMKRPTEPAIQNTGDTLHGQVPRISGVASGGEDFREQRIADSLHTQHTEPTLVRKN